MESRWWVIIADVKASKRLEPRQRAELEKWMTRVLERLLVRHPKAFRLAPQMLKGDEIQAVLRPGIDIVEIAAELRGRLLIATGGSVELRVGVGLGTIDRMSRKGPFQSDGSAFHRARAALERVTKAGGTHRVELGLADSETEQALRTMMGLLDAIMTRWTLAQWEAVLGRLEGKHLREIASGAKVTVQSVSKRLQAAAWDECLAAMKLVQSNLRERETGPAR